MQRNWKRAPNRPKLQLCAMVKAGFKTVTPETAAVNMRFRITPFGGESA